MKKPPAGTRPDRGLHSCWQDTVRLLGSVHVWTAGPSPLPGLRAVTVRVPPSSGGLERRPATSPLGVPGIQVPTRCRCHAVASSNRHPLSSLDAQRHRSDEPQRECTPTMAGGRGRCKGEGGGGSVKHVVECKLLYIQDLWASCWAGGVWITVWITRGQGVEGLWEARKREHGPGMSPEGLPATPVVPVPVPSCCEDNVVRPPVSGSKTGGGRYRGRSSGPFGAYRARQGRYR